MIWWKRPGVPDVPEAPELEDRSSDIADLRARVAFQRAHSWRAIRQTEQAVAENHFGPKFAAALREAPR